MGPVQSASLHVRDGAETEHGRQPQQPREARCAGVRWSMAQRAHPGCEGRPSGHTPAGEAGSRGRRSIGATH